MTAISGTQVFSEACRAPAPVKEPTEPHLLMAQHQERAKLALKAAWTAWASCHTPKRRPGRLQHSYVGRIFGEQT